MTPNLWTDMERLNDLYEELCWPHTDELTMQIEGDKVVIRNLYQEQREKSIHLGQGHPLDNT
tara:strand:- start:3065 stop:3250 length:186 start_codon:yes stop_codon:yes gene_type:complete